VLGTQGAQWVMTRTTPPCFQHLYNSSYPKGQVFAAKRVFLSQASGSQVLARKLLIIW
jgi:hypothetical protein